MLILPTVPAAGQAVIASNSSQVGNLTRAASSVAVGPGPLDRFQMVRLQKDGGVENGAILFLSPLGSSFDFYEQTRWAPSALGWPATTPSGGGRGGKGFGAWMGDQLALFGSTDVTFLLEPDFGHVDHFMTKRHREYVERPIARWLRGVSAAP